MKNFKFSSSANGKVFRNGLYSTAILAAAIVLAVLINLLVGAIPKKYTEFDLSAAKMYTLGDSSRQLMQSLDQDVTVYYLCETGSEDAIITKLLDHYADESGHFHWEQKDPALYPTFAAQYGAENASTGSLIVVSGENSEVLNAAEPVIVDFWAEWCGPCRQIGPALEELAAEYAGKVKIVKVNVDENPESPAALGVRGIPALFLFKDGKVVSNKIGAAPKAALKAWIDDSI